MNLDPHDLFPFHLTRHARDRLATRGIGQQALQAALCYGRVVWVRGAEICAIGRREVQRYLREGIDLSRYEGVQVVCSPEGAILTAYRNRHLSLHPHQRRRRRCSRRPVLDPRGRARPAAGESPRGR